MISVRDRVINIGCNPRFVWLMYNIIKQEVNSYKVISFSLTLTHTHTEREREREREGGRHTHTHRYIYIISISRPIYVF